VWAEDDLPRRSTRFSCEPLVSAVDASLRFLASWIDCWLAGGETEQPGGGLAAARQVGPLFDADTATRIGSDWR